MLEATLLTTGDLIQISVRTPSRSASQQLLDDLATNEEMSGLLSAIPTRSAPPKDGEFGDFQLVQEFILVAGAQLTAESLIASVRAVLGRLRQRQAEAMDDGEGGTQEATDAGDAAVEPEVMHVSLDVPEEGVAELVIRLERRP